MTEPYHDPVPTLTDGQVDILNARVDVAREAAAKVQICIDKILGQLRDLRELSQRYGETKPRSLTIFDLEAQVMMLRALQREIEQLA